MFDFQFYELLKVWKWDNQSGGCFININRLIVGLIYDKDLFVGKYLFQFYLLVILNGVKVMVMLEELFVFGKLGVEYDVWMINIGDGDQFGFGFVGVNLNFKIFVMVDYLGMELIWIFEFVVIFFYFFEKFNVFVFEEFSVCVECYFWFMW